MWAKLATLAGDARFFMEMAAAPGSCSWLPAPRPLSVFVYCHYHFPFHLVLQYSSISVAGVSTLSKLLDKPWSQSSSLLSVTPQVLDA